MKGKQKRDRETQAVHDALIKQYWEEGKDDKFIAVKVFKDASFEAFVYNRRRENGWVHTKEP